MSKRIFAELSHDFTRRMQNWGRWAARGGLAQVAPSSMWSSAPSGSRGEISINTLDGEAEDTDRAFNAVPIRYRQAVMLFWQWQEQPLTVLARRCGGIDYRTYEQRVIDGHCRLRSEIIKRSQMIEDQREMLAKMIAA